MRNVPCLMPKAMYIKDEKASEAVNLIPISTQPFAR
jgi:hypothetical protein